MNDVTDLTRTIIPRSDQRNSEELLTGPQTIHVTKVTRGDTEEQPISIHYEGENGRPYKPCKTMRKLLILAWGKDGTQWAGKSMTIYCDPKVTFGGSAVGGIRISHLSDIDPKGLTVNLTATRGRKAAISVQLLKVVTLDQVLQAIKSASNKATMDAAKSLAQQLTNPDDSDQALQAYRAKVEQLRSKAAPQPEPTPATQDSSADFTPAPDDEPPF